MVIAILASWLVAGCAVQPPKPEPEPRLADTINLGSGLYGWVVPGRSGANLAVDLGTLGPLDLTVDSDPPARQREYIADAKRIPEVAKDMAATQRLADVFAVKWRVKDVEAYARLMHEIVDTLRSAHLGPTDHQRGVAQLISIDVLSRHADKIPLEVEFGLADALGERIDPTGRRMDDDAWAEHRRKVCALWHHAAKRLHVTLDDKWDPNAVPLRVIYLLFLDDTEAYEYNRQLDGKVTPEIRKRYDEASAHYYLSITHKLFGQTEPEVNVRQPRESPPDDHVAGRRIT